MAVALSSLGLKGEDSGEMDLWLQQRVQHPQPGGACGGVILGDAPAAQGEC